MDWRGLRTGRLAITTAIVLIVLLTHPVGSTESHGQRKDRNFFGVISESASRRYRPSAS